MEGEKARAAAEEEEEEDDGTETFEAAEALAGLGRRSDGEWVAASSSHPSQDPATTAVQRYCRYTSNTVTTTPGNSEKTLQQPNHVNKAEHYSNQAEREARKLRRIQANRESARQSIRRRQDVFLELTRKEAYLSEENGNLKKEMELTMAKYNSLKQRNEFLKAHMMKMNKAERQDTQGEPGASTNPPLFLYNQPSLVPCFWPSFLPSSSDVYPLHCGTHPNFVGSSSQFLVPDQGRENSAPVFLLPIPWMFPVLTRHINDLSNETSPTQQCRNTSSSMPRHHNNNDLEISGVESNSASAIEHTTRSVSNNDREPFIGPKKREDALAATEARKKRKELMKMKNIH